MKKLPLYAFLFSVAMYLYGCKSFEKAGNNLGLGLNKNTKDLGRNLISGVQEGLTDSAFRQNLKILLDTVINEAGLATNRSLIALRDSVLSDKWFMFTRQLVEELSGPHTLGNVALLRKELVGDTTRRKVKLLVSQALNQVLNDNTNAKLGMMRDELLGAKTKEELSALRNELLGPRTNEAIRAIVDTAMMTVAYRMKHDVKEVVGENASFIQKYVGRLLIIVGLIAAGIIFLVWRNRQKYLKLVTVLTNQIHAIPDQGAYNDLTSITGCNSLATGRFARSAYSLS